MDNQTSTLHVNHNSVTIAAIELTNRNIASGNVRIYLACRQALSTLERLRTSRLTLKCYQALITFFIYDFFAFLLHPALFCCILYLSELFFAFLRVSRDTRFPIQILMNIQPLNPKKSFRFFCVDIFNATTPF